MIKSDKYFWDCVSLLSELGVITASEEKSLIVSGINMNSRLIEKGDLFIALQGDVQHGVFFAQEAIDRGAIAIACDVADLGIKKIDALIHKLSGLVPVYWVSDLKNKLGLLASKFFGHPSKKMSVIGITGTNGKSTCMHFIASLFRSLGCKCGVSGTLGRGVYPNITATGMTTPDVISTHRYLAALRHSGVSRAVMEVSSHALEQNRVQGVEFDVSIFTNLSHDHLDYHHTMERYFESKKTLFTDYSPQISIINMDDSYAERLKEVIKGRIIGFSMNKSQGENDDISGYITHYSLRESCCLLSYKGEHVSVNTPFFADFFISNLLASLAVFVAEGIEFREIVSHIGDMTTPVGRLECVSRKESLPKVWIDYAHTPDALEHVLLALQKVSKGRLWCIFGCGGDRDKEKRPIMGRISEKNSDIVIVTSDNPRGERPENIASDIAQGFDDIDRHKIILNREKAIQYAVINAEKNDFILIAGKGHEMTQDVGDGKVVSLDEREIINEAFRERQ